MIRALLIDDEKLALRHLENLLGQLPQIERIETYTDPVKAIQIASEYNPNVIFLDISMPELNGMQAAEMLQQVCPESNIVFVTAYDTYAIEAFELNVLDYILKPIQKSRLEKTIQRLAGRLSISIEQEKQEKQKLREEEQMFCCFQSLHLSSTSEDSAGVVTTIPLRWRTSKAQELFAYLLHNRNRFVSKDVLLQQFWPEHDFKKASTYLYTTIYHVRQCLKQANVQTEITNKSGNEGYVLLLGNISVDVDVLENGINSSPEITAQNVLVHQKWSDLYTGDYFEECDYSWAAGERQRLRAMWVTHALKLVDFYVGQAKLAEALKLLQKMVRIHPYSEEGYLRLMQVFNWLGEHQAVEELFMTMDRLFEQELGIEIPAGVSFWYKEWRQQNSERISPA